MQLAGSLVAKETAQEKGTRAEPAGRAGEAVSRPCYQRARTGDWKGEAKGPYKPEPGASGSDWP